MENVSKILPPAATPYIFTGLRIGIGMSLLTVVASKMPLGGVGVSFFIWDEHNASRISDTVPMITHGVDEAALLSDRTVMMTNGPAAGIGQVRLDRPGDRLAVAEDPACTRARAAVIGFLDARLPAGADLSSCSGIA